MKIKFTSILTKILLFIAFLVIIPTNTYSQEKGAKTVKTNRKAKRSRRGKGSFNSRKRAKKKTWSNQNKATKKRMKRIAKNARRRQKGKPMKNNRLV